MAEPQKAVEPVTEPQDILYYPGISFANPKLVKLAAPVRVNPWFWEEKGVGPLSASSKLRRWEANPSMSEYRAIWNRRAKQRNMSKLGAYFHAVPTISELGQAPPASKETTAVSRGPLGFLDNLLTTIGQAAGGVADVMIKREEQKTQAAMARSQSYFGFMPFGGGGDSSWIWILGIGAIGVGAFIYFKRR